MFHKIEMSNTHHNTKSTLLTRFLYRSGHINVHIDVEKSCALYLADVMLIVGRRLLKVSKIAYSKFTFSDLSHDF